MNNDYASLNIKEWKLFKLDITQTRPLSKHFDQKNMSKFKTPKTEKWNVNVHKIGGTYLHCVNNHYAKFEYKVMNTVGVTNYTN